MPALNPLEQVLPQVATVTALTDANVHPLATVTAVADGHPQNSDGAGVAVIAGSYVVAFVMALEMLCVPVAMNPCATA
ncbi:MAG: hypothetical protein WBW81_16160 [Methylocella sp.]